MTNINLDQFLGGSYIGYTGSQGGIGYTGSKGEQGIQGIQGFTGSKGEQGVQGIIGYTGSRGETGFVGSTGPIGPIGYTGSKGDTGFTGGTGFTGSQGDQGVRGFTGSRGDTGFVGSKGDQGNQGIQGPDGNFGGATFDYTFSTSTTNSDPGTGNIRFNNANVSIATQLYIDDQDDNATDIQSFLRTIDDSTSVIKGHFRISNRLNADDFAMFTISSISENTGYFTVNCSYVSGSATSFSNAEDIIITFARTGDKGDTGYTGSKGDQGSTGFVGSTGDIGFTGSKGDAGEFGATGFTGSQGIQGATGFTGSQGIQGIQGDQGVQGVIGYTGSKGDTGFVGSQGTGFTGSQGESGILLWERKTANYTAVNQDGIIADTTGGTFIVTLPATPSVGDYIVVVDGGDFESVNLTVARNGSTIEDTTSDLILDVSDVRVDFVYDGSTWQVFSNVGQRGYTGSTGSQGVIGYTGSQGVIGYTGSTGSQGVIGYTGSQGVIGYTGSNSFNIVDDTTTNATRYITFTDQTSGTSNNVDISSSKLYFNPSTGQLNATEFNSLSDETMKTDLSVVDNALELINSIEGLRFKWKENGTKSLGVSAQQMENVLPELVSNNGEFKTVNYNGIIAVLIQAIKELNRKIK